MGMDWKREECHRQTDTDEEGPHSSVSPAFKDFGDPLLYTLRWKYPPSKRTSHAIKTKLSFL